MASSAGSESGKQLRDEPLHFRTFSQWLRAAVACQVDLPDLLRQQGMEGALVDPVRAEISRVEFERLMSSCIEQAWRRHPPRYFPVALAQAATFEYLSDLELMMSTAPSLRDIVGALSFVSTSLDPLLRFALAEFGAQARVLMRHTHTSGQADASAPFVEQFFLSAARFVCAWLQDSNLSARLTFRHERHRGSAEFEAAFPFAVSVDYGQDLDAAWFDRSLLDRPLRGAMPDTHRAAIDRVARGMRDMAAARADVAADAGVAALAEKLLRTQRDLLPGGVKTLAERMGMHPRALQRRLQNDGVSYVALRDRVRFELAKELLQDPRHTVEHIAQELGFSERTGFAQAFERWSGCTPRAFRHLRNPRDPGESGIS